ncbi:alpha/beta hydrolase fold domain-containing protein [Rhodobacterales bacterium HKCCE2091]|nr:alpha/beta hydrolase fold domain-containing protein [Rhodobacterales bacterium HKCCE2091]
MDWDDWFENGGYIPGAADYPARWAEAAAGFRAAVASEIDLPYGPGERNRYDLFRPEGTPKGLVVFVHGGYWLRFDKSTWSHLAAGPLAAGWAVAMPSYTLAPAARIADIGREIATAIAAAAERVPDGPVRLTGHSAGGHLAARMIAGDGLFPGAVAGRVDRVVPISGVFDLRLLQLTRMNEALRIDTGEAAAESPALLPRHGSARVTAWVGAAERPEFLRQTRMLAEAWDVPAVYEPGKHHFDVIAGLEAPDSPLTRALVV